MIKVINAFTGPEIINPLDISRVIEASSGSRYHGAMSIIKLRDGTTIECRETVEQIEVLLEVDAKCRDL